MPSPEQHREAVNVDTLLQTSLLLDQVFAPSNMTEYQRSLRQIQNQNDALNSQKYTIREGDNLFSVVSEELAKRGGEQPPAWKTLETLRRIAEKNKMDNPDLIHAGDVIDFSVLSDNGDNREEQRPPIDTTNGAQAPPQIPDSDDTADRAEPTKDTNQAGASGHSPRENWYISQERDGETGPWFGCAPTSLLMAMADYGLAEPTEANRQKLIRETGTARPLGFPGKSDLMSVEAQKRGLNSESRDTTDWREVDAQVEKGRGVIVNGTMKNGGKHFVYISGKDAAGKYIVGDPAEPAKTTWTTEDLRGFMSRPPGPLGYAAVWR